MSYLNPAVVLYLRPSDAIQEYRIVECANWLVSIGQFDTYLEARTYLGNAQLYNKQLFRNMMSRYFDAVLFRSRTYGGKEHNVNEYHAEYPVESYGEPHMY